MTNFSDFFPTAGGGGGIGQTITVGDYAYPNARNVDEWMGSRNYVYANDSRALAMEVYGGGNAPFNYSASLGSVADTYTTIADVTGASSGGALTFIGAHASQLFNSWNNFYTTRLTLDGGTPIEFQSGTGISAQAHIFFVGAYLSTTGNQQSGGIAGSGVYNYGLQSSSIRSGYDTTYEYFSGYGGSAIYSGGGGMHIGGYDPVDALYKGQPFVYFTTSCKVEIKVSSVAQGTNRKGYASILTF